VTPGDKLCRTRVVARPISVDLRAEKNQFSPYRYTSSDANENFTLFFLAKIGPFLIFHGRHVGFGVPASAMRVENFVPFEACCLGFSITSTVLAQFKENRRQFGPPSKLPIVCNGILRFFKMAAAASRGRNFRDTQPDSTFLGNASAKFHRDRMLNERGVGLESCVIFAPSQVKQVFGS
jgi:hypothetical protein